jgi:nitrogen fixation NifU-like protein
MYTDKVKEHFLNPKNVGEIIKPSGFGEVGSPVCGDFMRLTLDIDENGIIRDIKFKTYGCGAAIASSSMATEMVKGKSIQEALKLTDEAVAEALGGLPPEKMHCSNLATGALHAAIRDYLQKHPEQAERMKKEGIDLDTIK